MAFLPFENKNDLIYPKQHPEFQLFLITESNPFQSPIGIKVDKNSFNTYPWQSPRKSMVPSEN